MGYVLIKYRTLSANKISKSYLTCIISTSKASITWRLISLQTGNWREVSIRTSTHRSNLKLSISVYDVDIRDVSNIPKQKIFSFGTLKRIDMLQNESVQLWSSFRRNVRLLSCDLVAAARRRRHFAWGRDRKCDANNTFRSMFTSITLPRYMPR